MAMKKSKGGSRKRYTKGGTRKRMMMSKGGTRKMMKRIMIKISQLSLKMNLRKKQSLIFLMLTAMATLKSQSLKPLRKRKKKKAVRRRTKTLVKSHHSFGSTLPRI